MNQFQYIYKHLIRSFISSLLILFFLFGFTFLADQFRRQEISQKKELDSIYENFDIRFELTDRIATEAGAYFSSTYISAFTSDLYGLSQYVKDLCFKRTFRYSFADPAYASLNQENSPMQLTGITRPEADFSLHPINGASITLFPGYSESILESTEMVCLLSLEYYNTLLLEPLDTIALLIAPDERAGTAGSPPETAVYTVIGYFEGGEKTSIYCPFASITNLLKDITGGEYYTDTISGKLNNVKDGIPFKETASKYFAQNQSFAEDRRNPYSLTVFDSVFLQTEKELKNTIQVYKTIRPILFSLALCTGFFAAFLLTRSRKQEISILRCLGNRNMDVYQIVLLEHLLLSIAGFLSAAVLHIFLDGIQPKSLIDSTLVVLFYLSGAWFSTWLILRGKILKLLEKQE